MKSNIVKLMQDAGLEPRRYSGRGMYGKTCVGVSIPPLGGSAVSITIRIVREAVAQIDDPNELEELFEALENGGEDSLGTGSIVYWPDIPWDEE